MCLANSEDPDAVILFENLPFPSHLGKYIIEIGKISTKIHEIGKIKDIFELGMTLGLQRYSYLTIRYISRYLPHDMICIALHF